MTGHTGEAHRGFGVGRPCEEILRILTCEIQVFIYMYLPTWQARTPKDEQFLPHSATELFKGLIANCTHFLVPSVLSSFGIEGGTRS
jgi:hypothetical protein